MALLPAAGRLGLLLLLLAYTYTGLGADAEQQRHNDAAKFRAATLLHEFAPTAAGREALLEVFEGHETRLLEALEDRYGIERGSWPPQKVTPPIDGAAATRTEQSSCSQRQGSAQQQEGFTGGLRWLFGAPVYVADIDGVSEANAVLSGVIKSQFEELDGNGWLADRTYTGNNFGALDSLLTPAVFHQTS